MGFDGFWNFFLLLLKIKRPGRLFRQIRYFGLWNIFSIVMVLTFHFHISDMKNAWKWKITPRLVRYKAQHFLTIFPFCLILWHTLIESKRKVLHFGRHADFMLHKRLFYAKYFFIPLIFYCCGMVPGIQVARFVGFISSNFTGKSFKKKFSSVRVFYLEKSWRICLLAAPAQGGAVTSFSLLIPPLSSCLNLYTLPPPPILNVIPRKTFVHSKTEKNFKIRVHYVACAVFNRCEKLYCLNELTHCSSAVGESFHCVCGPLWREKV